MVRYAWDGAGQRFGRCDRADRGGDGGSDDISDEDSDEDSDEEPRRLKAYLGTSGRQIFILLHGFHFNF